MLFLELSPSLLLPPSLVAHASLLDAAAAVAAFAARAAATRRKGDSSVPPGTHAQASADSHTLSSSAGLGNGPARAQQLEPEEGDLTEPAEPMELPWEDEDPLHHPAAEADEHLAVPLASGKAREEPTSEFHQSRELTHQKRDKKEKKLKRPSEQDDPRPVSAPHRSRSAPSEAPSPKLKRLRSEPASASNGTLGPSALAVSAGGNSGSQVLQPAALSSTKSKADGASKVDLRSPTPAKQQAAVAISQPTPAAKQAGQASTPPLSHKSAPPSDKRKRSSSAAQSASKPSARAPAPADQEEEKGEQEKASDETEDQVEQVERLRPPSAVVRASRTSDVSSEEAAATQPLSGIVRKVGSHGQACAHCVRTDCGVA
jgi:hypothetical protein